ncbi:hypothetical protein KL938_000073 [Ogataea parapolymorpha]|nr:hypothetical protein KL938_000073 [Ogataea parapolymorpha]
MLGLSSPWPCWRGERKDPFLESVERLDALQLTRLPHFGHLCTGTGHQTAQCHTSSKSGLCFAFSPAQSFENFSRFLSGLFFAITAKIDRSVCAGQRQDSFWPPNRWCSCSLYPKYTKTQSMPAIWPFCVPKAPGFGS